MSAALTLSDLAAEQWGLVTTAQARALGVSAQGVARLTNQDLLERMTHGVYRVSGAPPEPEDELRAAWLTLEPERRAAERIRDESPAVVSHQSAAGMHRLGDIDADLHEFTTAGRKQSRRPDIKLHRGHLDPGEWTVVDGLPVTTVARTIADLAASRLDGGHLATVVRDALTVKQVSDQAISAALAPYARRYGAHAGDGDALVAQFLRQSGVSVALGRAVELSGVGTLHASATASIAQLIAASPGMMKLQEQIAEIAKQLAPVMVTPELRLSVSQAQAALATQMAASGALKGLIDPAAIANFAEIAGVTETMRQLVASPEFQRFLQQQKVAANSLGKADLLQSPSKQ